MRRFSAKRSSERSSFRHYICKIQFHDFPLDSCSKLFDGNLFGMASILLPGTNRLRLKSTDKMKRLMHLNSTQQFKGFDSGESEIECDHVRNIQFVAIVIIRTVLFGAFWSTLGPNGRAHPTCRYNRDSGHIKQMLVHHSVRTCHYSSNQCSRIITWLLWYRTVLPLLDSIHLNSHEIAKEKQKIKDAIRSIKFQRCGCGVYAASIACHTHGVYILRSLCCLVDAGLVVVVVFIFRSLPSNLCLWNFASADTQPNQIRQGAREHAFVHCKHHKMIKHRTLLLLIEFVSSASASAVCTTKAGMRCLSSLQPFPHVSE